MILLSFDLVFFFFWKCCKSTFRRELCVLSICITSFTWRCYRKRHRTLLYLHYMILVEIIFRILSKTNLLILVSSLKKPQKNPLH